MRVSKTKWAAGAIAIAMAFAAPSGAFATGNGNNGNNGDNGNHYGNQTSENGVEVTVNAELDIDNDSSAVATGGAGGAGGAGGNAVSTSSATGGAGGNANAWGGAGGNSNATGGNSDANATGGNAVATGGNATGGSSNATGGNATGGNATGGNATGGSADNSSVNSSNNALTSNNTNTNDANNTLNNANTNDANNTLNNANTNDASNTLNNANTNSADNSSSATGGNASADNNGNNNGNGNGNNNGNNNSSSSNSQSQSANNDNANSNNSDQSVEVNTYNERNPVSTAYAAPLVSGEDTCMGSSTLGAQAVSFGVSIGTTWQDANCRRLKNSRQLVALGYHGAATALMCVDADVRQAMEEAGTPCPSRDNPQPQMVPVSAPVATPAPCPTNDFVVPFDWDRSNLNRTAVRIIDDAVTSARRCNVNAVVVIGHTDTSGSNAYNTALSQRRAVVVRNAMIDRGVSADLIETASRGETDPALATGDGIREAANRRTAVTISFR